jgi:hypothetical protein
MCGTLRLKGEIKSRSIGSDIPSTHLLGPTEKESYKWDGFARSDGSIHKWKSVGQETKRTMVEQWPPEKWKPVLIRVIQFIERDKEGKEHLFKMVNTKGTKHNVAAFISNFGYLKIMTRPATPEVARIHHRMPVTVPESMSRDDFVRFINNKLGANYS